MSEAAQQPKQPKPRSSLEELGFILAKYIIKKYPLQDGVNSLTVHDDVTNEDFDITRKKNSSKTFVSKHKNQRRPLKLS